MRLATDVGWATGRLRHGGGLSRGCPVGASGIGQRVAQSCCRQSTVGGSCRQQRDASSHEGNGRWISCGPTSRPSDAVCVGLVGALLLILPGCSSRTPIVRDDSHGRTIICFGNSLTKGEGASPGQDYPSRLAAALGQEVINAGGSGDTTRQALQRLATDVLEQDPRLVIVQFGGNDFLQGISREETFANLDEIVRRIQERGAMVVLVGVPSGWLVDATRADYQRIAKARRVAFIPNILEGIMTNPLLKSDQLHPNDEGYQKIAERILKTVRPLVER